MKYRAMKYRTTKGDVVFNIINALIMLIVVFTTLYPFVNTIAVSFNNGQDSIKGGITVFPRVFTLQNYISIFSTGTLLNAFFVSVARTVLSAGLNIVLTVMLAYTLSRKEYVLRKFMTVVLVLTMYFNAGLIPNFLLLKTLGMYDSFAVYIVPTLISAFNVIIVRTYIESLPESIIESCRIDGAGDFTICYKMIFPLVIPAIAVVGLFVAVFSWNSWFDTLLYCSNDQNLSTLQFELQKILSATFSLQGQTVASNLGNSYSNATTTTPISIQAATTIVAMVPILCVYPFVQKYFVGGLVIGGVKE
jgi:putative aldouronate transport system permease protein